MLFRSGDGLLAFFGAPQPLENAERCALEAAQGLLEGLQDVNERLRQQGQPPLVVGVGIHTGEVVLGHVGGATHQEYTAIGAVINLAARLCADAADGQILASGRLAASIEDIAVAEDLGERTLRGMTRPVAVRNLTSLKG